MKRLGIGTGAALGATLVFAPGAQADTFVVDTTDDSTDGDFCDPGSDCTLREAAFEAAIESGDDVITFAAGLSGEINLSTSENEIELGGDGGVEIQGPGANVLTIDGQHDDRIFKIGGFFAPSEQVLISGLMLTGGDTGDRGGALYSFGYFDPPNYQYPADVTIADSMIIGNHADDLGGGIFNGPVYVMGSGVEPGGALTIVNSTIAANTAGDSGGGLSLYNGDLAVRSTTISGNGTDNEGGAIFTFVPGSVSIESSTLSGNTAYVGGAIFHYAGDEFTVSSSTITGNTADYIGGVANNHGEGLALRNTIVANSVATLDRGSRADVWARGAGDLTATQDIGTNDGSFVGEFSLVEDPAGYSIGPLSSGPILTGIDPQLGSLAQNGGPTQTHLPASTSPVLDQGIAGGLGTDQRGLARTGDLGAIADAPGGDGTDIGSVELQAADCQGQGALKLDGTAGDDTLTGTDGPDSISGLAGNDTANGAGGNDCVNGDEGRDNAKGGPGKDQVTGGAGNDKGSGGGGKDKVKGQAGKDSLKGGGGKDRISGGGGKDKLSGGGGKDKLKGGGGKDRITTGGGKDKVNCGGGTDKVTADAKDKVSQNCEKVVEKG
jgi:Ca2+-binding RTX toxin-like protein